MIGILVLGLIATLAATAGAEDTTEERLRALEERLRQQDEEIRALRGELESATAETGSLTAELDDYFGKVESTAWWSEPNTFRVYWDKGIRFATADGLFKIKFGGRIMSDWSWLDADDELRDAYRSQFEDNSSSNNHEFRRARLYVSGSVYDTVEFKAQYDFAGGDADFKDVWLGLKNLPVIGHFRVGHHKVAMGIETLTSSKYNTFMERGGTTALLPERKSGFFIFDTALDNRLTWAASYYNPATDGYGNGPIGKGFSGRIAGTPFYEKSDGEVNLVHVAVSGAFEDVGPDGEFTVSNRPPNHSSPIKPISIDVAAESRWIMGFEAALVYGPFSLQGEYVFQDYDSKDLDDPSFDAYYIAASYFVTGEQRKYKQASGAFDRVSPKANFMNGEGGTGAVEFALRYGSTDANDGDADGGRMHTWTAGINWYLNPNVRVVLNYFSSDVDTEEADGDITGFMMRFQIDF
jgi:phosphate-selective porin OprO and OprP